MALSQDHAELLRESRTQHAIATTISEQIPCTLSKTGQHPLTFSMNEAGVIVRLDTPCRHSREEYAALQRLGHPCCLTTLDWIRERLSGEKNWEYRDEPPEVSRWLRDLIRGAYDRAYYRRTMHRSIHEPTSMQSELQALLQHRINRYAVKPFQVCWSENPGVPVVDYAWVLVLKHTIVASLVGGKWIVFDTKLDMAAEHLGGSRSGRCDACNKSFKNLWVHNRSSRHKTKVRILLEKAMSVLTKNPTCMQLRTPESYYAEEGLHKMESLAYERIGG